MPLVCGPLISSSTARSAETSSSSADKVGSRSPGRPTTSSSATCAAVCARTAPEPVVVRSRVLSCRITATPSAVGWVSASTHLAPVSHAATNAGSVFSGTVADAPRCAITYGCMAGRLRRRSTRTARRTSTGRADGTASAGDGNVGGWDATVGSRSACRPGRTGSPARQTANAVVRHAVQDISGRRR